MKLISLNFVFFEDEFGWHVELDQRYVRSLLGAMAMNHRKSMATPGSKGQESNGPTAKQDRKEPIEFRSCAVIDQYMTEQRFDSAFSTKEIMREAAGPTTASQTNLKRIARYLKGRQRCVLNFPCVTKLEDVFNVTMDADRPGDPKTRCSTSGGVLAIGPCFTVRHWSVTQATVSLSSTESEAKTITKGCVEALCVKHLLEHQTARPFKIKIWTDSRSAKAIMERLGPGRRAKHLEAQTLRMQQLENIDFISLNKLDTLQNVADVLTKHVSRAVLDKMTGMMNNTISDEETVKFQAYAIINESCLNQVAAIDGRPVFRRWR